MFEGEAAARVEEARRVRAAEEEKIRVAQVSQHGAIVIRIRGQLMAASGGWRWEEIRGRDPGRVGKRAVLSGVRVGREDENQCNGSPPAKPLLFL